MLDGDARDTTAAFLQVAPGATAEHLSGTERFERELGAGGDQIGRQG